MHFNLGTTSNLSAELSDYCAWLKITGVAQTFWYISGLLAGAISLSFCVKLRGKNRLALKEIIYV